MTDQFVDIESPADIVKQVVHDVRQPLSGIENLAYVLEMSSNSQDPQTLARLDQVRQLVDHANWILEDAVQSLQPVGLRISAHDLGHILRNFAAQSALRDDRSLNLHLPPTPVMVLLDREMTDRMLQWIIQFSLSVAQVSDSPRLVCVYDFERAHVTISITPRDGDTSLMAELLDPGTRTGFLRTLARAQGATLCVSEGPSGGLAIEIGYPLV